MADSPKRTIWDSLHWVALVAAMAFVGFRYFQQAGSRPAQPDAPVILENGSVWNDGSTLTASEELPVLGTVGAFSLTNQAGIRVTQSDLEDRVWVANVIFSRCPGQCHVSSQQMARIQGRIPGASGVRFVSLTADPEYDTPAVLTRYGRLYGVDPARWMFLTGPKADVYELAMKGLLFSVVETDESQRQSLEDLFIHSTSFVIVDGLGRLRAVVQGEEDDAEDRVVEAVTRLTAGR